jgi:hypothetical protein
MKKHLSHIGSRKTNTINTIEIIFLAFQEGSILSFDREKIIKHKIKNCLQDSEKVNDNLQPIKFWIIHLFDSEER